MTERTCPHCDGAKGYLYREGQPMHILLNPWYECLHCQGKDTIDGDKVAGKVADTK